MTRTVCAYARVSTAEQATSGAGIAAQRTAIEAEASRRDWDLLWFEDAGASGSSLRRPGLQAALRALEAQQGSALVVAKLDRLSRSVIDAAGLLEVARKQGWSVVALDLGVDTTTPAGEMIATVFAATAQWERRIIGQRTKDALAERKAAGVRLGRPRLVPPEVVARIVAAHEAGQRHCRIARELDADGVPTPNGALRWYQSTVARIVASEAARTGSEVVRSLKI